MEYSPETELALSTVVEYCMPMVVYSLKYWAFGNYRKSTGKISTFCKETIENKKLKFESKAGGKEVFFFSFLFFLFLVYEAKR